jgi:hypothetical protein
MAINPKDIPLPTPSIGSASLSYQTLSPLSRPVSPRTQQIIQRTQQEAVTLASGSASPPRGRASTREAQSLCNALADMFGLPPLPIPQHAPARSSSPMAAISQSQSCCDELRQSPAASTVPTTRCHSPEPEEPSKQPITWDLKDPAHPLHRWGAQQAYKEHIKRQGYDYPVPRSPVKTPSQPTSPQQSSSPRMANSSPRSPGLESISEEDPISSASEAAPPGGHHQPPTMPGEIHQDP